MNTYFNASAFLSAFPPLLTRLPYTLGIVLESVVLGMFIGILLTCLGRSRNRLIKMIVTGYVWLMRGTAIASAVIHFLTTLFPRFLLPLVSMSIRMIPWYMP